MQMSRELLTKNVFSAHIVHTSMMVALAIQVTIQDTRQQLLSAKAPINKTTQKQHNLRCLHFTKNIELY